jgi:hypothetical protein
MGDGNSFDANINASTFGVSNMKGTNSFSSTPPFSPGSYSYSIGSGNDDSFGHFNLIIKSFDGFGHTANEITFSLQDQSGGWAKASDVFVLNDKNNLAASHIYVWDGTAIGAATTGDASGVTPLVLATTPLPGTVWLLGSGLVGLIGLKRKSPG